MLSVTYGGTYLAARIYEKLRKRSWRENQPPDDGMWHAATISTSDKHRYYVMGVRDALNEMVNS